MDDICARLKGAEVCDFDSDDQEVIQNEVVVEKLFAP